MQQRQYTVAAITLHWAIAIAIVANLLLGWWMRDAIQVSDSQALAVVAYQVHKSLGLSVLVLSLARLALRLRYSPPPLPASTPGWQRAASRATHWGFYALMIGLPLSGWLMVSTQWRDGAPLIVPTLWFGLFGVPHLFGLDRAGDELRADVYQLTVGVHELLAGVAALLLVLHVAAALKHQWMDGDGLLARMAARPGAETPASRRWGLRLGYAVIVLAAVAVIQQLAFTSPPAAQAAAADINSVPGSWPVLAAESAIEFAGEHAGTPFRGRFTRWQSEVRLDAQDIEASRIRVVIDTASATDGVKLHDETLPGKEWFDVATFPLAQYRSTRISPVADGRFTLAGILTIKDRDLAVDGLTLVFSEGHAKIEGAIVVDRAAFDMGMESDPDGSWVSREIEIIVSSRFDQPAGTTGG